MDLDDVKKIALLSVIISVSTILLLPNNKRWWVRPWIRKRFSRGNFSLIDEFNCCGDLESYTNFLRMDKDMLNKLYDLVKNDIEKQDTHMREAISAKYRLIITLRFLATGESFRSLQYTFRIGQSTISNIIPEVCESIYKNLKDIYLKVPDTTVKWLNISKEFEYKWNLPNVLGAMDGNHILFKAPRNAGSSFYNYKKQNSIVLLALVDADYKFIYVDVGTNGRVSDGGVFRKSSLAKAIANNSLNFPEKQALPGRIMLVPYVIVADAAFPLTNNILKPFSFKNMIWSQRIFNYRLSRVRRVVENAFGILANKWRVLLTPIQLAPAKVQLITLTCCVLHNFCREHCSLQYRINEEKNNDKEFLFIHNIAQQIGNRSANSALQIRNEFMEYVNNEGRVPWQNEFA